MIRTFARAPYGFRMGQAWMLCLWLCGVMAIADGERALSMWLGAASVTAELAAFVAMFVTFRREDRS